MLTLIRITDPFELLAVKDKVYPLFEKYYTKAKKYIEDFEKPEVAWEKCITNTIYPDFYLYLIQDDNEFIGFYLGCLLRMPRFHFLYTYDYYIPQRGKEFKELLKQAMKVIGAEEVWGIPPDNVLEIYKRKLNDSTVKIVNLVRLKL
jgi:hypothetical protein